MRSRRPRHSGGLLDKDYQKNGGKTGRYNARTLVAIGATVLAVAWLSVMFLGIRDDVGSSSVHLKGLGGFLYTSSSSDAKRSSRHKRKKKKSKSKRERRSSPDLPVCTPSPLEKKHVYPKYGCDDMEKMLDGPTKWLGQGYWREVRLAEADGKPVAVKTLRDTQDESRRNKERHRWEAVALDSVKGHPNIVHLLGLCECDVMTEYFPVYMDELILEDPTDAFEPFSDRKIIGMALDAARGLQALHEVPGGPIVHADLQPRQLLLNSDGMVKVNDLNRCRFMGTDEDGDPCPFIITKGNGVWRSPEEYASEPLTEKLDIYSMGMIFWAMLGRDTPFERDDRYKDRVLEGERPYVDPSWHRGFVELFSDMWAGVPDDRPAAGEVVLRLEEMFAELATTK